MDNIKHICEWCNKEFAQSEGISSIRFCSIACRKASTSKKLKEAMQKRIANGTFKSPFASIYKAFNNWKCVWCGEIFRTRREMFEHTKIIHRNGSKSWNKGRTKENCPGLAKGGKTYSERYKAGQIKNWCDGKHLPNEMKQKISESMKKAHAENRAHNIGSSRWNNEPSYPEKWFMSVIQNHFEDKNYIHEFPFQKYALDFAWVHKKKCIEVDGDQHYRFQENIERDKRKDEALHENGWNVLRIPWKNVLKDKQKYIQLAKQFIDR